MRSLLGQQLFTRMSAIALLTLAVLTFSMAPQAASAAPREHSPASQVSKPPTPHVGPRLRFTLRPGQTITVPFPLADDPGATLRVSLSLPRSTVRYARGSSSATAYSSGCYYGIRETETAYNIYGGTLYWFAITTDFCYNGTNVTYLTSPPSQSWGSCCFWGIGSHSSSATGVNTPYGQSKGNAHFNGPLWQSDNLWVLINEYGDGNYAGGGGSN